MKTALFPCPLCDAPAVDGSLDTGLWTITHACDCFEKRSEEYVRKVNRIAWAAQSLSGFRSYLPKRYEGFTFDNLKVHEGNREAVKTAKNMAPGDNLYIYGLAGNGKTHLAVATGYRLAAQNLSVAFYGVAGFMQQLRESFGDHEIERPDLTRPDVLILDDIGKTRPTEFAFETLYAAIESRYADAKTTIFTANNGPKTVALNMAFDDENASAIVSRLASGHVHKLTGKDWRVS